MRVGNEQSAARGLVLAALTFGAAVAPGCINPSGNGGGDDTFGSICGDTVCDPGESRDCADCTEPSYCGNGICEPGEGPACLDCVPPPVCGDGVCQYGETTACLDCVAGPPPGGGPVCGNGTCEAGETEACSDCLAPGWSCNTAWFGTDDGCDCGCSVADPDCGGGGCTIGGCDAAACEYCWPGSGGCAGGAPLGADCSDDNCAAGLLCVLDPTVDDIPRCATECIVDVSCAETCSGGETCVALGTYDGVEYAACLNPRPEGAPCGCDFGSCDINTLCVDATGAGDGNGYCYWGCTYDSDCYSFETCEPLVSGDGICWETDGGSADPDSLCTEICGGIAMSFGFSSLCDICGLASSELSYYCEDEFPGFGGYVCELVGGWICDLVAEQTSCSMYDCAWACGELGF